MSSASGRLSFGMTRLQGRSGSFCHPKQLDLLKVRSVAAHQSFPTAIKCTLRKFISNMSANDAIGLNLLAVNPARQLKPFSAFDAQAIGAAIEHFDVVGRATPSRTVESFVCAESSD